MVTVKDNQPTVRQDLIDFFADTDAPEKDWQMAKNVQKGHGRLEVRKITTSEQMNTWFELQWAEGAQIFYLHRWVQSREGVREEHVYGLTNLPRGKASARRLLELNQAHWRIENRLHYRRDVTLGEDACQVRRAGAPEALAALNGGILALMDWLGVTNVAAQMRHFCAHPHKAIHLLCRRLSR